MRSAGAAPPILPGAYAARIAREEATVRRDEPFSLSITDSEGRRVVVRGVVEFLVLWRDGSVDTILCRDPPASTELHGLELGDRRDLAGLAHLDVNSQ